MLEANISLLRFGAFVDKVNTIKTVSFVGFDGIGVCKKLAFPSKTTDLLLNLGGFPSLALLPLPDLSTQVVNVLPSAGGFPFADGSEPSNQSCKPPIELIS